MVRIIYPWIIYLHVFSVILSIGPYFVLIPLLRRLKESEGDVLHTHLFIFRYVVWISKHAGHLLVVTGALLWWLGGYSLYTSWILIPILILLSSLFFLARAFSPAIRQLENHPEERHAALRKLRFSLFAYLIILLISMWFMIAKPIYW